jgi:hypothetical protein
MSPLGGWEAGFPPLDYLRAIPLGDESVVWPGAFGR